MNIKIKTALISVSDKSGLDLVVQYLHKNNISILGSSINTEYNIDDQIISFQSNRSKIRWT